MEQKYKTLLAALVIILSLGLVVHANVQDALKKRRQVKLKIGTGICNESDYAELEEDLTRCSKKSKKFQIQLNSTNPQPQLCSYLNGAMMCFDPFKKCYTSNNLKKLKGANLEGTVELVAEAGNEYMANLMRDCLIYKQIVGLGRGALTGFDIFHIFLLVLICCTIGYFLTIKKSHPE